MIDSLNYSQNKDRISEEVTEEEIIDNYCIDEDDEEYIEDNQNQESEQVYLNQNLPQIQEESIINEKEKEGNNIKRNRNNQAKTKFQEYYYPKFELMKKKLKKTETVKTTDDLFNEAFEKNKISNVMNQEYNNQGNTMSKNISDNIYDKYVYTTSKNCDILSKMKDEEVALQAQINAYGWTEVLKQQWEDLQERIREFNGVEMSRDEFMAALKERLATTNIEDVKLDVGRFLINRKEIEVWSNSYFLQLADMIVFK